MSRVERGLYVPEIGENATAKHGAVLSPDQYYVDFRLEASQAKIGELVFAQTMAFGFAKIVNGAPEGDFAVEQMFEAFSATPQGVPKRYRIDSFSLYFTQDYEPTELLRLLPVYSGKMSVLDRERKILFDKFREIGVEIEFTNPPKGIQKYAPFLGRSHLKNSGVGDRVFYMRGFNDDGVTAGSVDFAVKFIGESAGRLRAGFEATDANKGKKDYEVEVDGQTRLLMDTGVVGQSMIYNTILEQIVASESSIRGMSALMPDGRGAKALSRAYKKGEDVEVFVSPEGQFNPNHPISVDNVLWFAEKLNDFDMCIHRAGYPVFCNQIRNVHGKAWIFDGKTAIFGTHNASEKGIRAGTCEAAVVTTNKEIIQGLENVFSQVKLESYPDIKGVI